MVYKNCMECDKKIWVIPSDRDRKFCSRLCQHNSEYIRDKRRKWMLQNNPMRKAKWRKKVSIGRIGYKMPESQKNKYSIMFKGENNPNWNNHKLAGNKNPAWIDGRSQIPYSNYFKKKLRQMIYEKYDRTCQLCGDIFGKKQLKDKNFITAHHIDYNKLNNSENNLIALCQLCNVSVNRNREEWINFFNKRMEVNNGIKFKE